MINVSVSGQDETPKIFLIFDESYSVSSGKAKTMSQRIFKNGRNVYVFDDNNHASKFKIFTDINYQNEVQILIVIK